MKITLYNPKSNAMGKRIMPFSLLAIGAVLEGEFEYSIVDGNGETDPDAALLARGGPGDVVGMTVMPGPQLEDAVLRARALRRAQPDIRIVWGGYFPTEHASVCLDDGFVDFAFLGHAEGAIVELLRGLRDGRDPRYGDVVEGLAFKGTGGEIVKGGVARVPNVESLPEIPFHRLDMNSYPRRTFLGERTLGYHSSYGCPFLCNFCGVVSLAKGRFSSQSAERVERSLRRYRSEWDVDAVEFYDNNFFTQEERCRDIAHRIHPLGFRWWGEGRIDTLLKFKDETWRAMTKSGLRMIFLGAESGSKDTLARMDKGGTLVPEMTLDLAAKMREHGVTPEFSFVLGNPPEPARDIEETIAFVRRVKERHEDAEIILYQYTPVPVAGELLDAASKSGFSFPKTIDEWISPQWREVSRRRSNLLPWVDAKQTRRIRDFERVLNAYYPTSTDARLTGMRRAILRAASGWRYRTGMYAAPFELRALQKLFRYQRPETAGF